MILYLQYYNIVFVSFMVLSQTGCYLCFLSNRAISYVNNILGELNCRKEFYKKYAESKSSSNENVKELTEESPVYYPDESILIGVQYTTTPPATVTISLLSTCFNIVHCLLLYC